MQHHISGQLKVAPEHTEDGVQIVPINKIAHVHLDDLVGYEIPKKKLIENTEAFVEGRRANNCLLFGDAGTGKSSSIKAILNQYYDQGLRMIEIFEEIKNKAKNGYFESLLNEIFIENKEKLTVLFTPEKSKNEREKVSFQNKMKDRYENMSSMSPEVSIIRNYIEVMLNLPWEVHTEEYDI